MTGDEDDFMSEETLLRQKLATTQAEIERLEEDNRRDRLRLNGYLIDCSALNRDMAAALEDLVAVVRGECPSLLNEDSGGNAELDMRIDQALERHKQSEGGK